MADKDKPEDGPSLEMPSFSLRRRRNQRDEPAAEIEHEALPEPEQEPEQEPVREPEPVAAPEPVREPALAELEPEHAGARERRGFSAPSIPLPSLAGAPAAAVTGVVVGALAVLLTWLAVSSCDVVRGTKSCGGGPGFLILLAVLLVLAYSGGWLLARFGVPDAKSTSFLAVGVMAVIVMLFLLDAIYDWWMVIAIPVVSVTAFIGSWWVTQSVVDDDNVDTRRSVSVR